MQTIPIEWVFCLKENEILTPRLCTSLSNLPWGRETQTHPQAIYRLPLQIRVEVFLNEGISASPTTHSSLAQLSNMGLHLPKWTQLSEEKFSFYFPQQNSEDLGNGSLPVTTTASKLLPFTPGQSLVVESPRIAGFQPPTCKTEEPKSGIPITQPKARSELGWLDYPNSQHVLSHAEPITENKAQPSLTSQRDWLSSGGIHLPRTFRVLRRKSMGCWHRASDLTLLPRCP